MAGAVTALIELRPHFAVLLALIALLVATSVIDDLRGLPAWVRLLAHLCAAAAFCLTTLPDVSGLGLAVAVIATAWMTNLYNFMDGSDGLAGGMAVIGFAAYAVGAGSHPGEGELMSLCAAISASSLAFLLFNFPPARIFMGDAGSIPLGFLAGSLGALGWYRDVWPAWFPLLVFSPFIVDATVTLARRIGRREAVWRAHRDHYYQRLVRSGLGHRGTALSEWAVMLGAAGSALWLLREQSPVVEAALVLWMVCYAILAITVDRRWMRFIRSTPPLRDPSDV
jgi:UDP-N-acetylmuramyl pentapeptide phosphotransferase/UDP-N-acetylglucosamine-1-phosphate transferase